MKNIHVLPTDKPSVLYKRNDLKTYHLGDFDICSPEDKLRTNYHIYITSDEEIKEGDYFIAYSVTIDKKPYISCASEYKERKKEKGKIILTTDQDLIKDGVQAIDDEFLEWFINNQSCESVEVRKECCGQCDERLCEVYDRGIGWNKNNTFYKIIIPKEEPKQETFEEAEEAAYKFYPEDEQWTERYVFKLGAKWQKERMYSEEDMREAYKYGRIWDDTSFEEWLEQFKKDSQ